MRLKRLAVLFVIVVTMAAANGCSKAVDLSLNMKKGDNFIIHSVNEQNTIITIDKQEIKTSQVLETALKMNVQEVDKDQNVTMAYNYDSIKSVMESSGKTVNLDTKAANESNPLNVLYKEFIGKGYTVKMNSRAQVIEIKGIEEMLNSILAKFPGNESDKEAVKKSLYENFGEEAVKNVLMQLMNYYPEKAIRVNDVWETKYESKTGYPTAVKNKCKFLGSKNGVYSIETEGTVSVDTKDNPVDFLGVKANLVFSGDSKGTVSMDKTKGFIQNETITQYLKGNVEIIAGETIGQSVKVPLTSEIKISSDIRKQ